MLAGISIEPFRGDLEGLERMVLSSWRDEYGISSFPNLYRPPFLRFLFERLPDKRLLIAAYQGKEIVSFFANLPRRFRFESKTYHAVLSCILATRKEFLRRGLATEIIKEGLKINNELKYDFALLTLETGHRSTKLIKKLEEAGHPLRWVKRMHVIARVLDLARVSTSEGLKTWEEAAIRLIAAQRPPKLGHYKYVREYRPKDLETCLGLLNQYQSHLRLARVWEGDELAWELSYPDVSQTLVYEKEGKVEGLINFIYHDHHGKTKERWAWINHVAYPGLSTKERTSFVQAFLNYIRDVDCVGAIEWTKKYYPLTPMYRSRFFPYFRAVNMFSWNFNPDVAIQNIPDVYEVQI
jgi:hypothetical protein